MHDIKSRPAANGAANDHVVAGSGSIIDQTSSTVQTVAVSFADMIGTIHRSYETIAVCTDLDDSRFSHVKLLASQVPGYELPQDLDTWFSVNPVSRDAKGRGGSNDVTRWAALYADLDVGPGNLPSLDAAHAVIDELSIMLGTRPAFIIFSGHGLQPIWTITKEDRLAFLDTRDKRDVAKSLLKRWQALVTRAAKEHGADGIDSVFDLARILRVPGTVNHKPASKLHEGALLQVPTSAVADYSEPLTVGIITEVLDGHGIAETKVSTKTTPTVPAPAPWGEMDPKLQDAVRRYLAGAIKGATEDMKEVATWPIGYRDGSNPNRGWQKWVADIAYRFGSIAQADWSPWTPDDALEAMKLVVPAKIDAAVSVDKEFAKQHDRGEPADWPDITATPFDDLSAFNPPTQDEEETFWTTRPVLTHIRDYARSVRVAPYALLGALLARVAAVTPPGIRLPGIIGGKASLNWFALIVGPSGSGKGAVLAALEEAFHDLPPIDTHHPGSGEGLLRLYAHFVKGTPARNSEPATPGYVDQHTIQALAVVDEVDVLTALQGRSGSNIMPMLRSAWSGSKLGIKYAAEEKALHVDAHRYRLSMIVQAQPERCQPILDGSDGGTPQRFIWFPALDPGLPAIRPDPVAKISLNLKVPEGRHTMKVPPSVIDRLDQVHVSTHRDGPADELDGHAGLVRLKTAALFAILDGREHINPEDWWLAEYLGRVSDTTRGEVQSSLATVAAKENLQRGRADGKRQVAAEGEIDEARSKRITDRLRKHLSNGPLGRSELRRKFAGQERPPLDVILIALHETGELTTETTPKGEQIRLTS